MSFYRSIEVMNGRFSPTATTLKFREVGPGSTA